MASLGGPNPLDFFSSILFGPSEAELTSASDPSIQRDSFGYGYVVLSEVMWRFFMERAEKMLSLYLKLTSKGPKSLES